MSNNFKLVLWEDGHEYCQMSIELAHKEVVDRNRRFLSREAYCEALNENRIKELLEKRQFLIQWGTSDKPYIDPSQSIGTILDINTEKNSAIIRVSKDIKEILDKEEYVLIFNYLGTIKSKDGYSQIINPRIIGAGLLQKSRSAYEVEVV